MPSSSAITYLRIQRMSLGRSSSATSLDRPATCSTSSGDCQACLRRIAEVFISTPFISQSPYGVATKFWVREVAGPEVPLPEPTANWLTCQIWFAVAGSGVAAA